MTPEEALAIYHASPETVVKVLLSLSVDIESLRERVKALEDQIAKNSRNSNKPPFSDGFNKPAPRSLRKRGKRKPGGQSGHSGQTLKQVKKPDHITVHPVEQCQHCSRSISDQLASDCKKRQIAIFRPASGLWSIKDQGTVYFGVADDIPLPGDYNGDGTGNIAVFLPKTGLWSIKDRETVYFGGTDDIPVPADYNGDGEIEIAIFRPATGFWSIKDRTRSYFGRQDDIPVPADYDGNGKDDIALFRNTADLWAV
ncbi:MAG: DUF6444 domain-containing protein [Candidatus Auribacterota bacterium]|nr:DUF6444 domain-containing protein [Candidatus Auribacterota bacterium]